MAKLKLAHLVEEYLKLQKEEFKVDYLDEELTQINLTKKIQCIYGCKLSYNKSISVHGFDTIELGMLPNFLEATDPELFDKIKNYLEIDYDQND